MQIPGFKSLPAATTFQGDLAKGADAKVQGPAGDTQAAVSTLPRTGLDQPVTRAIRENHHPLSELLRTLTARRIRTI